MPVIKKVSFTLVINAYLTNDGSLPGEVVETLKNASIARRSSRFCDVKICLVMNASEEHELHRQLEINDLSEHVTAKLKYSQKLPMIGDILRTGQTVCQQDDYICYINSDINLLYWFFDLLAITIKGHQKDAGFIVNRKDIVDQNANLIESDEHIQTIYHPGFDCFVFPQKMLENSHFGTCTVGFPPVGALLATNMLRNLPEVRLLNDSFVTWHRGDGQSTSPWINKQKEIAENFEAAFKGVDKIVAGMNETGETQIPTLTFSKSFLQKYISSRNQKKQI